MSLKIAIENPVKTTFVSQIQSSFETLYGNTQSQFSAAGLSHLDNLQLPTSKTEFWKYTRTARLTKNQFNFHKVSSEKPAIPVLGDVDCHTLVFDNGIYMPNWSDALPAGVTIDTFASGEQLPDIFGVLAQTDKHIFEALNAAFLPSAIQLQIAANVKVDKPIRIANWSHGAMGIHPNRLVIEVGAGSKVSIISSFHTDAQVGFTNAVAELFVGENANLQVYKIQDEGDAYYHHSADYVQVDAGANFGIHTMPISGGWMRNNLHIKFTGSNAFARLNGLYILEGDRHVDNNTFVDHAVPHCDSSELYKGVLYGRSTGVFNGKVIVRPDAQKTNAFQQNNNLILSEEAQMNSKPELEIYADDVKCSHGSTTGQLDEEAIFYLQARAIAAEDAKRMLTSAFAGEVLDFIENEELKNYLIQKFNL
jgi:Fe-S cluster assembly protein SufD